MSMKTALNASMDVTALLMDCRDKSKEIFYLSQQALLINPKLVSAEIEGQMRLRKVRKGEYASCKAK